MFLGCPTCRTKFNLINIVESYHQQQLILRQIDVLDKAAPKDDGVLDLSAIPDDDHVEEEEEGYENCVICASNERAHEQVVCDGCSRTFHVSCLGIAHLPFCDWFCPTCEVDGESMLFSTFNGHQEQQPTSATTALPPRRRRRRPNMIPSLSTSPLPLGDGSSIHSTSSNVTESPTPKLSADEMHAWEMLEFAQNAEIEAPSNVPSTSSVASNSSAPSVGSPKFKRPTRRHATGPSTTSSSTDESNSAGPSQPTFMQSLLNDIRNTSTEISIEPPKRNPKTQLSLEKKEKVQALVRDALRPVYRSGTIDKDEYTRINKTVSRSLYGIVVNEKDRDFSKYRPVVESYVDLELQNSKS